MKGTKDIGFGLMILAMVSSALNGCRDGADAGVDTEEVATMSGAGGWDREKVCEEVCSKYESCFSDMNRTECDKHCGADEGWSNAAGQIWSECLLDLSCDEIEEDDIDIDDYPGECFIIGVADFDIDDATKQFCEQLAETLESCNSANDQMEIMEDCEDVARGFTRTYLDELAVCLDEPCDDLEDCTDAAAEIYNTSAELDDFIPVLDECCQPDDPCNYADDGYCDCDGTQSWDTADC